MATQQISVMPNVHTGSGAPGVTDDSSKAYKQGDFYIDTATEICYMAASVAVGAASWKRISNA